MKNNLLEINFLQNIIEKFNQRISELREEIKNGRYNKKKNETYCIGATNE